MRLFFVCFISLILISGCAPTRYPPGYHGQSQPSTPISPHLAEGGKVKRGNPYQIDGLWYYPLATGEAYDEVGIASWYGEKFHGLTTANGEKYNMYAMTAAHTTLPMPSIVRVTNLENGKSIEVRVNDRGPFVKSRLIDLSYAAAKALGYDRQGTTKVRVQTLYSADVSHEKVNILRPEAAPILVSPLANKSPTPVTKPIEQAEPQAGLLAYVQVGAFATEARAHQIVEGLKGKAEHASAQVIPQKTATGQVYRVRLGPFDLDADANQTLQSVQASGYPAAMVIHD